MRLLVTCASALIASTIPAVASAGRISAGERTPAVLIVIAPGASVPSATVSDLLLAAAGVFESSTALEILSPEQIGVDQERLTGCPEEQRLRCWISSLGPDTDRAPSYLFVVSVLSSKDENDRLSTLVLDLQTARRALAEEKDAAEDAVFQSAVHVHPGFFERSPGSELDSYFSDVRLGLSDVLARRDHQNAPGRILLEAPAGLELLLDGRLIGLTDLRGTEIVDLRPGRRLLILKDPTRELRAEGLVAEVEAGETLRLTAHLRPRVSSASRISRSLTFWGGVGTVTAGLVLSSVALLSTPQDLGATTCLSADCEPGRDRGFASFCELGSDPLECQGGALAAPLGFALIAGGGVWSLGTLLFSADDEVPWLPLASGLLLGGATYGLSAAAGG